MKPSRQNFGARFTVAAGALLTFIPMVMALAEVTERLLPGWSESAKLIAALVVSFLAIGLVAAAALLLPSRGSMWMALVVLLGAIVSVLSLFLKYVWEPSELWMLGAGAAGVLVGGGGLIVWHQSEARHPVA
jgi:hypothetical protein